MATNSTASLSLQNFFSTTLSAPITASDTTIYLTSLPTGSEGFLLIDAGTTSTQELIFYNAKGANFVTVPTVGDRGRGGTTAQAHSSGAAVKQTVNAEYWTELQAGRGFSAAGIGAAPYADGWTPLVGVTPNTVTANGNRNYDLVFNSVDLTSQLSPGMKLKLTRTVAAPDQCADLEASSSQYFSKSSPAGMTFTDDFVVSAWVKLESYTGGDQAIVSRYNGTSGWMLRVLSTGQVLFVGYNGGASNNSYITSYASLPLNKWVHVAAQLDMSTFTASTTTSYIMFDGVDVASVVTRGGTNPTALVQAGNLEIGSANATNFFDGKIAQVAIYSAKVTQATIKASMDRTLTGSETSLISAYSFDNSLNDLNANANNLTANGGAAATAPDSPFANAVAAGLLEYAEVNSVTFSTNTTVNVRVPDTCQIPTSGGVSAVSYSTQSNPYGLPYFSKVLGEAILGSSQSTTSTSATAILGLSTTVYIPSGARYRVSFTCYSVTNSLAGNTVYTYICEDIVANQYSQTTYTPYSNGVANTVGTDEVFRNTGTGGSKTFLMAWLVSPGGTATLTAAATQAKAKLVVELV